MFETSTTGNFNDSMLTEQTTTGDLRTKYYDGSGNIIATIPEGYNVVGTCGVCGGPIIQSMIQNSNINPQVCLRCGRHPKNINPLFGPVVEMNDKDVYR